MCQITSMCVHHLKDKMIVFNQIPSNLNLFKNTLSCKAIAVFRFHTSSNRLKQVPHPFKMKSKNVRERQQQIIDNVSISNQHEILADMVTPYWKISYEEELGIKQRKCEEIVNQVLKKYSPDKSLVVNNIIGSPVRDAYRNKDEFSVWPGLDGDPKTVGFFIGSPAVGKVLCIPPTHIRSIKESHKELCQLYQDFIRSSPLPACHQLYDGGFWRNIVIRSNDAGDHMALVITHPGNFSPEQIAQQQEILKQYFNQHAPSLSLFHQSCPHLKCSRTQAPIHHLSGQPYLKETMSNCTFRISPDSFFQVNTAAAELLFQQVIKVAKPKHYTTLLDLYCGTGVISMLVSENVRGSVGVEEVDAAIQDAKYNAKINNVTNCKFMSGRVEFKLPSVLNKLDFSTDVVAVVNPGRAGASEGVISLLCQSDLIRKVVYISCKPDNPVTLKNFNQLCERISSKSKPFHLSKAVPVDLFPYSDHCELILCFEKT